MATLSQLLPTAPKEPDLLLISHPALREQLLQARQVDEFSARCVIERGDQLYFSLREISDPAERQAVNWAILRLQMGAKIAPQDLPEPLKTTLTAVSPQPSSFMKALICGAPCGVVGGVMVMALVGLAVTILNVPTESYVGIAATAVAFVLSGTAIGLSATIFFWRKFAAHKKSQAASPFLPPIIKAPK
ncbi:MAG: hypothetical protein KC445_00955 [Anaerolineales bacterium]|nr:hypothetical protein [Anaerolineales bacterium]